MRVRPAAGQVVLAGVLLSAPLVWYLRFLAEYPLQDLPFANRIVAILASLTLVGAAAAAIAQVRTSAGVRMAAAFGIFFLVYPHLGSARWTFSTTRLDPTVAVKALAVVALVAGAVWVFFGRPRAPAVRVCYAAFAAGAGLALFPVPTGEELRRVLIALLGCGVVAAGLLAPGERLARHRIPLLTGGILLLLAINPGARLALNLAAVTGISVALGAGAWELARSAHLREFVAAWLVLLALLAGLQRHGFVAGANRIHVRSHGVGLAAGAPGAASRRLPDVYLFVFDAHTSPREMLVAHRHDMGPFVSALRRRGLQVPADTFAPYVITQLSVGSTLNWEYVGSRLSNVPRKGLDPVYFALARSIAGDNRTVRAFRRLGYRYVYGSDSPEFHCRGSEDVCLEPAQPSFSRVVREYEIRLLGDTPLKEVVEKSARALDLATGPPHLEPSAVLRVPPARDRPTLFVVHILSPHAPYRYVGASCRLRPELPPQYTTTPPPEGAHAGYVENALCIDGDFLRTVDAIAARTPDAIIVAQGDHGSRLGIDRALPVSAQPRARLRESFGMFYAQRMPRRCRGYVPRTAIDIVPGILACMTGRTAPDDPPRHFWQLEASSMPLGPTEIPDERLRRLPTR